MDDLTIFLLYMVTSIVIFTGASLSIGFALNIST